MSEIRQSYWRGLPAQDEAPGRAAPGDEFAAGASDTPDAVNRRTMLKLVGGSLSLAGLSACRRPIEKIVPFVQPPEEMLPGVPLHYATTMPFGGSAYGLVVESHQGRPTKIEGNEQHPATRGASSAWMQASILGLYDPDRSQRVRGPAKKEGEPPPATWAEFEAAWKPLAEGFAANGGQGLAVLTEAFASPTLERLAAAFRARYPQARWAAYEPLGNDSARAGLERATGGSWRSVHHFERASVILSLDADPLMTDLESVRHGSGFAEGRRADVAGRPMSRLYAVESAMSVTGANADHRLRLRSSRIAAFVERLAAELQGQGVALAGAGGAAPAADIDGNWIRAVAHDLTAHPGRGLVLAGDGQPSEVHAAVYALNAALGNVGSTVTLTAVDPAGASSAQSLGQLVRAMAGGEVSALVMLGGNPVFDAPVDLEFASALAKVGSTFHLSLHDDETSRACAWHLPRSHYLESWADARSADGTSSVVQPLIAPLFDSRSSTELLSLLAGAEKPTGYEQARETWKVRLGEGDFERSWAQVLHDGLLQGTEATQASAPPPVTGEVFGALRGRAAAASTGFELVFRPSAAVYDGRFANNAWLQELPDPITKITWDNAALVSPATAASLGVKGGEMVRIRHVGRELALPAWVVPGQADDTVVLPLGYGRRAAGRVGDGVGFDAYPLRSTAGMGFATDDVEVVLAGGTYELADTQHHGEMDELGEVEQAKRIPLLVREASLAEHHEHPGWVKERAPEFPPLVSLWVEPPYTDEHQWGMAIDLNACTGCNACVIACQSENNIPVVGKDQVRRGREMHWIRVDRYFKGDPAEAGAVFQPVPCMHCENAPCEQVCPVAATVHDAQGLNTMVYNRCIGTRYCSNNCPYKVRRFNFYNFTKDTPEIQQLAANPDVTVRSRGVMEKCTYCVQRINEGRLAAKLEGRALADGDVRTACEQACPARAISFGNLRDASSRVAQLKQDPRNYVLLEELNNKPRTSYLGKLRNPNPALEAS